MIQFGNLNHSKPIYLCSQTPKRQPLLRQLPLHLHTNKDLSLPLNLPEPAPGRSSNSYSVPTHRVICLCALASTRLSDSARKLTVSIGIGFKGLCVLSAFFLGRGERYQISALFRLSVVCVVTSPSHSSSYQMGVIIGYLLNFLHGGGGGNRFSKLLDENRFLSNLTLILVLCFRLDLSQSPSLPCPSQLINQLFRCLPSFYMKPPLLC